MGIPVGPNRFRIILISLAFISLFISFFGWALSSPVNSSPDDDHHVTSIWCGLGDRQNICETDEASGLQKVPNLLADESWCFAFNSAMSGSCQRNISDLTADAMFPYLHINSYTKLYPPLYYTTLSTFASTDANTSVLLMRAFNGLLFVCLFFVLIWASPSQTRTKIQWLWLLPLVPLGFFIISSTNPSSWSVISSLILLPSLYSLPRQPDIKKKLGLSALSTLAVIIAAGSRGDAIFFNSIAVVTAFVLLPKLNKKNLKYALAYLVIFLVGLSFLPLQTQVKQASGGLAGGSVNVDYFTLIVGNIWRMPKLWAGALGADGTGNLGWLDTPMPQIVLLLLLAPISYLIIRLTFTPKSGRLLTVAIGLLILMWAIPGYLLVQSNTFVGSFVQTRYILPLLIMEVFVCLVAIPNEILQSPKFSKIAPAFYVVAFSIALFINTLRYTNGLSEGWTALLQAPKWWWANAPFTPLFAWGISVVAFTVASFLITSTKFTELFDSRGEKDIISTVNESLLNKKISNSSAPANLESKMINSRASRIASTALSPAHQVNSSLLKELWLNRRIISLLTFRDVKTKYKDSFLGIMWSLLKPLTQLLVFYFIIGKILGASRAIPDFAIFVFSGITLWTLFSEAVISGTKSISSNSGLVKKANMSRAVFPVSALGTALFSFVIQLALLSIATVVLTHFELGARVIYAPLAVINAIIWALALSFFLSALNVYVRDIEHLIDVGLMLGFWATPVVYSYSLVQSALGHSILSYLYLCNPIALSVMGLQRAVWNPPNSSEFFPAELLHLLGISIMVGAGLLALSYKFFNKLQGNFAQQL